MLTDKAKDTAYYFDFMPDRSFKENYGIYLHVPFCSSICSFCPYYRIKRDQDKVSAYLDALIKEIDNTDFRGNPKWMYIGGGTPNILTIDDLSGILCAFRKKASLGTIGIELTPSSITKEYLEGLKALGIAKISLGVETFSGGILDQENRNPSDIGHIRFITDTAHDAGLTVSFDIMIGFINQKIYSFRTDMEEVIKIGPDQVTVYPLMTVRGTKLNRQIVDDKIIFMLIEEANVRLKNHGYQRKTLWSFVKEGSLYDSSYDELGSDYLGFGPSAITSTRQWVCVNLTLDEYIYNVNNEEVKRVFLNRHVKTSAHEGWRQFGMSLYECKLKFSSGYPFYLNIFIAVLKLFGFSIGKALSKKGLLYAHDLTKAIVETKSFPIQHPGCIANKKEFDLYCKKSLEEITHENIIDSGK